LYLNAFYHLQLSDSSIELENDSYFADPESTPKVLHARREDDVRRSTVKERFSSEFVIPVGSVDGVWGMMKQLGRFRGEGWFALWKGTASYPLILSVYLMDHDARTTYILHI